MQSGLSVPLLDYTYTINGLNYDMGAEWFAHRPVARWAGRVNLELESPVGVERRSIPY